MLSGSLEISGRVKISIPTVSLFLTTAFATLSGGCTADGTGVSAAKGPAEPTSTATMGEAFRDAEAVASRDPGRVTARGSGVSMAPVYGDNTLLVINPIHYEELKPGMTVAYVNSSGVRVVHKLVSKTKGGWFVIGINNGRVDEDLVTPQNLIGVIYASFHYTGEQP